jgi:arylsulfatase
MGSAATHLCLGPGWSTVSNTPFRRHKTWVHEGGISTPLIVHWPAGIKARGELRAAPGHVIDIVPTMLQAAGGDAVQSKNGIGIPVLPGESLLPTFEADAIEARSALWWLHEGNRALRSGDFKIVATKDAPWELYDLSTDRSEEKNLAGAQPERLRQLVAEWDRLTSEFSELAKANPIPAE